MGDVVVNIAGILDGIDFFRWDIQQTDVWLCPELGYPKCANGNLKHKQS